MYNKLHASMLCRTNAAVPPACRVARGKREYSQLEVEYQRQLGQRIKALRQAAGLIQDDFADAAGLERSYIPKLEAGQYDPRLSTLTRVARALKMDVSDLLAVQPGQGVDVGTASGQEEESRDRP
jgi:DNA-binding XRE family transcriptional regulator